MLRAMKLDFIFYFRILKDGGGEKSPSHDMFTAIYRNLCMVGGAERGLNVRNLIYKIESSATWRQDQVFEPQLILATMNCILITSSL